MKRFLSILVIAFVFAIVGFNCAYAKQEAKTATVVYSLTPAPVCQNCVNKIKGNLRFEKGVKDVTVDLENEQVTITYLPDKTNKANLEKALKKIGYTASEGGEKTQSSGCSGCCSTQGESCPSKTKKS